MQAKYTDGTPVQEGDRVRYHQTPGGLLPPGDWREGVAVPYPYPEDRREGLIAAGVDPDELHVFDGEHYYHAAPHIIERL